MTDKSTHGQQQQPEQLPSLPSELVRLNEKGRQVEKVFSTAKTETGRGYAHSLITGTLFPVSPIEKGKNSYTVERKGDATYLLVAGTDAVTNEIMMPSGIYPRLIMCWIAEQIRDATYGPTETCDPETRTITVPSINRMMKDLRISIGGPSSKRFMSQLYALLTSSILIVRHVDDPENPKEKHDRPEPIATNAIIPRPENPSSYANCSFVLNSAIFDVLAEKSMPYIKAVMEHLISKGGSVMRFDMYLWLSETAPRLQWPLPMKWQELYQRFGRNYSDQKNFRKLFRKALNEIAFIYPTLRYETNERGIVVHPSPKQIRRNNTLNLEPKDNS